MRHDKIQKKINMSLGASTCPQVQQTAQVHGTPGSDPRDTPQQALKAPDPAQHPRTVTCGKFGSSKPVRSQRAHPKATRAHGEAPREPPQETRTHGLAKSGHRQNSCDTYTLKVHDLHEPYMVYRTYKSHAI